VNNCLLAITGPTTPVTVYSGSRPRAVIGSAANDYLILIPGTLGNSLFRTISQTVPIARSGFKYHSQGLKCNSFPSGNTILSDGSQPMTKQTYFGGFACSLNVASVGKEDAK
jgi:hypothetical protein